MSERVELRAERLRVLLAGMGEEPTMNWDDALASGLTPGGWRELLGGLEYEHVAPDIELACELANLGRDLRARQWELLEQLGALLAGTEFGSLPTEHMVAAARLMVELWGHYPRRRTTSTAMPSPASRDCPAARHERSLPPESPSAPFRAARARQASELGNRARAAAAATGEPPRLPRLAPQGRPQRR